MTTELTSTTSVEREALIRAHRFQEELLGIIGHDLRAPIGAILLATELLAIESTRDAIAVMRIVSFAKRMSKIIDQVIDLTRVRLGDGIPLARCQTRLKPIIEAALQPRTTANPGSRFVLADMVDARGVWDADRLGQVIASLLDNALQYGRHGGTITVAVTVTVALTAIVVHNELGDDAIALDLLASKLERALIGDQAGRGWGLGLQIGGAIVRGHGGTIAIDSSAAGTSVTISLPNGPR